MAIEQVAERKTVRFAAKRQITHWSEQETILIGHKQNTCVRTHEQWSFQGVMEMPASVYKSLPHRKDVVSKTPNRNEI